MSTITQAPQKDASPAQEPPSCFDESVSQEWFDQLCEEVNFRCSICEVLLLKIEEMEAKVKSAYAATARSLKGIYDQKIIANRWLAMVAFAQDILGAATFAKDANQICGADLSGIEALHAAALERFQMHCPVQVCSK